MCNCSCILSGKPFLITICGRFRFHSIWVSENGLHVYPVSEYAPNKWGAMLEARSTAADGRSEKGRPRPTPNRRLGLAPLFQPVCRRQLCAVISLRALVSLDTVVSCGSVARCHVTPRQPAGCDSVQHPAVDPISRAVARPALVARCLLSSQGLMVDSAEPNRFWTCSMS